MNASTKTFGILAFSLSLALDLSRQDHAGLVHKAKRLAEASETAIKNYPLGAISKKKTAQIEKALQGLSKYGYVGPGKKKLGPMLSFILCGTDDLLKHIKNKDTKILIEKVNAKTKRLYRKVDMTLSCEADFIRAEAAYNDWAK